MTVKFCQVNFLIILNLGCFVSTYICTHICIIQYYIRLHINISTFCFIMTSVLIRRVCLLAQAIFLVFIYAFQLKRVTFSCWKLLCSLVYSFTHSFIQPLGCNFPVSSASTGNTRPSTVMPRNSLVSSSSLNLLVLAIWRHGAVAQHFVRMSAWKFNGFYSCFKNFTFIFLSWVGVC